MQSTETSQFTTDATQAPTAAVSPFGPVRKREQPPVTIPGQRKASDLRPRPPFPAAPTRTQPLSHDVDFNRGAYDESFDRFRHHADRAFGEGPGSAA